ncbi:hypothetical protein LOC67_21450 [Stieleria sp. JC731]|uniref:hypothetical protein n=1 Tax=Pirellulaceae TaxID=2691357 RepID=UPI001E55CAFD|nr:hypothetical protein [Stieleria sp. JC731]MCC9603123.1 hypothetical protein [Stieleria sp. JC731]
MRKLMVATVLSTLVFSGMLLSGARAETQAKNEKELLIVKVYKLNGLPVFTEDKQFSPDLLMKLIQSTVSPSKWEAAGGTATMAPYPQNTSLVISANGKTHDKIVDLIEGFRK